MISESIKILIIFIAGVVVGGYLPGMTGQKKEVPMLALKAPGLMARQREKKEAKKRAILETLNTRLEGKITPFEVVSMFNVSNSTATKYLDELEQEGKLRKLIVSDVDNTASVFYFKN